MLETMELLGTTGNEIIKNKNGENVPQSIITLSVMIINEIQEFWIHFSQMKHLFN